MTHIKTTAHHHISGRIQYLMLVNDFLALLLGYYFALIVTPFIGEFVSRIFGVSLWSFNAQNPDSVYYAFCAVILLLFYNKGHYNTRIPWWSTVQFIVKVMMISFLVFGFISFLLNLKYASLLILTNFIVATTFVILTRYMLLGVKKFISGWSVPTVLIGDYTTVTDALYAFAADPSTGYEINAVFFSDANAKSVNKDSLPQQFQHIEIKGNSHSLVSFMKHHKNKFHIISIENFRGDERDEVIKTIYKLDISHALIPSFSRMSLYDTRPQYFFGHDVMLLHTKPYIYSPFDRMAKRSIDILLSTTALLFFMPVLALMCVLIKIEGQGGSLFYGGYRIGRKGKKFKCWKFRTMEPDTDHLLEEYLDSDPKIRAYWDEYRKLDNDPRITTKTAQFVRKASLDEVPQLWNVLVGDMSIVGPRPILDDELEMYGDMIGEYIKVRPGITGL